MISDTFAGSAPKEKVQKEGERWYAVQTQSRHENRVKGLIEREKNTKPGLSESIFEVEVPTHEISEIRKGKPVTVVQPKWPGYLLVRMILNEETEDVFNAIKGARLVRQGQKPQALPQEDVNRLLDIEADGEPDALEEIPFRPGQSVEVIQGPFTDFSGMVKEVDPEKGKVKVEVKLFGRPTSVELDFTQLRGF